jgi:hypothetical protein
MTATTHPINCDCDMCELDTLADIAELMETPDTREEHTMKSMYTVQIMVNGKWIDTDSFRSESAARVLALRSAARGLDARVIVSEHERIVGTGRYVVNAQIVRADDGYRVA